MASAPHLTSPSSPQGAGEQPRVKGQEVVDPVGHPLGLRHLHLAAVPHASLGMEVMEEVPEGETVYFQACLEDPEWERGRMSHRAQEATRLHIYNSPIPVCLFAAPQAGAGCGAVWALEPDSLSLNPSSTPYKSYHLSEPHFINLERG